MIKVYAANYKLKENEKKYEVEHQKGLSLLQHGLKEIYNLSINDNELLSKIKCEEHGKPFLDGYSDIHFNISHSGEYVAVALSEKPVGVDIEKIKEYNYDVLKRVCNEKELIQIEESLDKASEFIKLWTQKEAVLKMKGCGIAKGDIKNCLVNHNVQSEKIEEYWLSVCEK